MTKPLVQLMHRTARSNGIDSIHFCPRDVSCLDTGSRPCPRPRSRTLNSCSCLCHGETASAKQRRPETGPPVLATQWERWSVVAWFRVEGCDGARPQARRLQAVALANHYQRLSRGSSAAAHTTTSLLEISTALICAIVCSSCPSIASRDMLRIAI